MKMQLRRVQAGDVIAFSGLDRVITSISPYRGPLYPAVLPDAVVVSWRPGPTSGMTVTDPNFFCGSCSRYGADCGCER